MSTLKDCSKKTIKILRAYKFYNYNKKNKKQKKFNVKNSFKTDQIFQKHHMNKMNNIKVKIFKLINKIYCLMMNIVSK